MAVPWKPGNPSALRGCFFPYFSFAISPTVSIGSHRRRGPDENSCRGAGVHAQDWHLPLHGALGTSWLRETGTGQTSIHQRELGWKNPAWSLGTIKLGDWPWALHSSRFSLVRWIKMGECVCRAYCCGLLCVMVIWCLLCSQQGKAIGVDSTRAKEKKMYASEIKPLSMLEVKIWNCLPAFFLGLASSVGK